MKIKIEKNKIESHIQKVSRLANKHLTLPVLSCVYIEATSQKIILKSTNLDVGLEISIKADVIEEGKIAVPASVLLGSLQSIKENDLVFESIDNNLKISSGKNSVIIKSMPHDDFPSIPVINKDGNLKSIKINAKDLMLGFRSVWYSASNSNIKPELSSVFVYTEDSKLVFVSTDSFRLAEKRVNTKVDSDFPHTLIPYKNVSEILKIFEDYNGDFRPFDGNGITSNYEGRKIRYTNQDEEILERGEFYWFRIRQKDDLQEFEWRYFRTIVFR